ncbi:MAG TPA: hypothetical protein VFA33_28715 [Bryobacteraceae bacterium]|nr:hypothetical protein [Bryobacteraceae bacterium]
MHRGMARVPAAALALLGCLAPLRAATLERLSLGDMIQKSTAIVRGQIGGSYAAFRGNMIYTHVSVAVRETLKGGAQASVDVVLPGGAVGNVRQTYSGVPQLAGGKEYVLFLWTGKSGLTQVIGFTQGVFSLSSGAGGQSMAIQQSTSDPMVDPASGQVIQNTSGIALRLSDLRSLIANASTGAAR